MIEPVTRKDGFPVVTPTEKRVEWMLQATRRHPAEIIGHIPPAGEVATVREVAIHECYDEAIPGIPEIAASPAPRDDTCSDVP